MQPGSVEELHRVAAVPLDVIDVGGNRYSSFLLALDAQGVVAEHLGAQEKPPLLSIESPHAEVRTLVFLLNRVRWTSSVGYQC